jgi:tripartite-type tricarboxylate transporter receptor subunit TctC
MPIPDALIGQGSIGVTRRGLGALAALAPLHRAHAQGSAWPDRSVRAVVPFGPGGAIDILIRVMAPHVPPRANGQALLVENRPGAGGTIGAAAVAQARPDGHTLLMAELGSAVLAHELYRDLPYDPRRSFTPVIFLADMPLILVTRAAAPWTSLGALLEDAQRRPGTLSFASVGTGHIGHLTMEALQAGAPGAKLLHVVYRSGAEMVTAAAKGEVDVTIPSLSSAGALLQAGALRVLAVSMPQRIAALPEVPIMAETVPGVTASLWYGLVGPAGMPPELVARINAIFGSIAALPEVRDTLQRQMGAEVIGGPPERFARHLQDELARWTPVLRAAGIRAE